MRLASDINPAAPLPNPILSEEGGRSPERYADYKIIRRNGAVVGFEPDKIAVAITKAFLAVSGRHRRGERRRARQGRTASRSRWSQRAHAPPSRRAAPSTSRTSRTRWSSR